MDEIRTLWDEHLAAGFPDGCAGEEVAGIDLVLLDADIAGCVQTFVDRGGRLDVRRTAVLGRCYHDAMLVTTSMGSVEAQTYFRRLESLAGAILSALSARAPAA